MPGLQGITSVAEMRARRIKREEKEARAQGRQRATTPKPVTPKVERAIEPDAFRKR